MHHIKKRILYNFLLVFSGVIAITSFPFSICKFQSSLSPSFRLNWFITAAGTVVRKEFAIVDALAIVVLNPIMDTSTCIIMYIIFTIFFTINYPT